MYGSVAMETSLLSPSRAKRDAVEPRKRLWRFAAFWRTVYGDASPLRFFFWEDSST